MYICMYAYPYIYIVYEQIRTRTSSLSVQRLGHGVLSKRYRNPEFDDVM